MQNDLCLSVALFRNEKASSVVDGREGKLCGLPDLQSSTIARTDDVDHIHSCIALPLCAFARPQLFYLFHSKNQKPWEFALIGSAAFSAGVTRAVSTAVIVFELSGENHLRLPLGVALMISYFIANRFTKGVYDALMDTNGTPHLEEVTISPCCRAGCSYKAGLHYFPLTT